MKKIYNTSVFRWMLLSIILPAVSFAQENKTSIKLLDASNESPIIGATYQYGNEKGISDADGIILLNYEESETLYLSHISYGQWQLSADHVKAVFENKIIKRYAKPLSMQPVTIIGLKPHTNENDKLNVSQPDRLAHDAGEVLCGTSAISGIRKSGSYGLDPVLRGYKYDQLNIVIDGSQCASAACPNRMDPPTSQISINMMDHVEIMKGPHSLRYGSAFGGTLNFVSVTPTFSEDKGIYGRVSSTYESNGDIVRGEGKLGLSRSAYDLNFFGSWSQGNDYTDGEGISVPSAFLRGSFGSSLAVKLGERQKVMLTATRNLARDTDFPALPMDLRSDDTWLLNARHEISFTGKALRSWSTSLYSTKVSHMMDNLDKQLDPRMMNAETSANTGNYGGRTEGFWVLNGGELYIGGDFRLEQAEGTRTREFLMGPMAGNVVVDNIWQNSRINKTSAFSEYTLDLGSTSLVFSGRLEFNNASANDPASEFVSIHPETEASQVNPSISMGSVHQFKNGFNAGLWLGRAQRSGSLSERYINFLPVGQDPYEMVGTPDIKPEVNNQVDLNLGYKTQGTIVGLSLFTSFLKDYISSEIDPSLTPKMPTSPGVRRYINIDEAFMTGFEISWDQKLLAGLNHKLSAAYTYGQNKVLDQPLPEIAPMDIRYALSGSYVNGKLVPEVSLRYVLTQDRISTEFGETETPSFTIVDASIGYKASKLLNATLGVQNLFGTAYYEHLSRSVRGTSPRPIYAPGRNIFISVLVNFE